MGLWITTIMGRDHFLSGPQALMNEPDIYEIAHACAQINRYSGHATRPFSVAEHQLLCADLAKRDGKSAIVQLGCLTHDAHEAYTGDASSPAKHAIGLAWAAFEHPQADRVRRYLGISSIFTAHRALIHHYDMVALATERAQLMRFNRAHNLPWPGLDEPCTPHPPAEGVNLNTLERVQRTWIDWKGEYLERYFTLHREVQLAAQALVDGMPTFPAATPEHTS